MTRTAEQVVDNHLDAFASGDFERLMADYADDAVVVTLDRVFVGKEGVAAFFQSIGEAFPNVMLTPEARQVHDDTVLVFWTADSDTARVETGVDTLIIRDGKIQRQTVWFKPMPK